MRHFFYLLDYVNRLSENCLFKKKPLISNKIFPRTSEKALFWCRQEQLKKL